MARRAMVESALNLRNAGVGCSSEWAVTHVENTAIRSWADELVAGCADFRRVSRVDVVGRVIGGWLREGTTRRDKSFGEYDVEPRWVLSCRGRSPCTILFATAGAQAVSAWWMSARLRGERTESMM